MFGRTGFGTEYMSIAPSSVGHKADCAMLTDIIPSHFGTSIIKVFDAIGLYESLVVEAGMGLSCEQDKIVKPVICANSVYVMNDLGRKDGPS